MVDVQLLAQNGCVLANALGVIFPEATYISGPQRRVQYVRHLNGQSGMPKATKSG